MDKEVLFSVSMSIWSHSPVAIPVFGTLMLNWSGDGLTRDKKFVRGASFCIVLCSCREL
jgi:hypothetical protein